MMSRHPPAGPIPATAKPGATREQVERRERFERARRDSLRGDADGPVVMYGWHTVTAALQNPARRVRKLLATENAARRLTDEGIKSTVTPEIVRPSAIAERLLPDAVHQGLYLETDPLPSPAVEDLPAQGVVLVLDQITDPHNVGAIFRSAATFAATAIVTTQRHSPDATGALAKAASGALEYVPLVSVQNLARGLAALKDSGFLVVGSTSGDADLAPCPCARHWRWCSVPRARACASSPRKPATTSPASRCRATIKSLNVSNAAALGLYVAEPQLAADKNANGGPPPPRASRSAL